MFSLVQSVLLLILNFVKQRVNKMKFLNNSKPNFQHASYIHFQFIFLNILFINSKTEEEQKYAREEIPRKPTDSKNSLKNV